MPTWVVVADSGTSWMKEEKLGEAIKNWNLQCSGTIDHCPIKIEAVAKGSCDFEHGSMDGVACR